MKLKTLITAEIDFNFFKSFDKKLSIEFGGVVKNYRPFSKEELVRKYRHIEILITEYEVIDKYVINSLQNLKFIGCCRTGIESAVDLETATEKGIPVVYTPGRNANAVADFAIGLLFDLTRNISLTNHLIKNRKPELFKSSIPSFYTDIAWSWDKESPYFKYRGKSLSGKNLGIIGFGKIGKMLTKKAKKLNLKVLVCDPFYGKKEIEEYKAEKVDFTYIVENSDFLVLCCKVTPDTKDIISKKILLKMKSSSYIINIARGALLNEDDLCWAIKNRVISGAALDVFKTEPLPMDSPLLHLENIILTPHLAGVSEEVYINQSKMMAKSIKSFLEGKIPKNIANPEIYK